MKKTHLFLLLGLAILFSILIGTGHIKLNIYRSKVSNNISSRWNNSKSICRYTDSTEEVSFPPVPVVVVYKSQKIGDLTAPDPVQIDISDQDFGPLWFPLFKNSGFSFTVTCKHNTKIKTGSTSGKLTINGEIDVSGRYKVFGLCSSEMATNLVIDKVMHAIYAEIKKNAK